MTQVEIDEVIEQMVKTFGLTERNILRALTEQQCRVWLRWAVLGRSEDEIANDVFGHCKKQAIWNVKQTIRAAQVKIISELFSDMEDIKAFFEEKPELASKVKELIAWPDDE